MNDLEERHGIGPENVSNCYDLQSRHITGLSLFFMNHDTISTKKTLQLY